MKVRRLIAILITLSFAASLFLLIGCDDEEVEIEFTESDKNRVYSCGETGHFDDYYITIDNPIDVVVGKSHKTPVTCYEIPIHIECVNRPDNYIEREYFSDIVRKKSKKELPAELSIHKGDVYDGFIYISCADKSIRYSDSYFDDIDEETDVYIEGEWKIDKKVIKKLSKKQKKLDKELEAEQERKEKEKEEQRKKQQSIIHKCSSISDIVMCEKGDRIEAEVYYHHMEKASPSDYAGYPYQAIVSFDKDGEDDFLVSFTKDNYKKASSFSIMDPTKITIRGIYAVEGFKGEYGDLITFPLIKKVEIINK